ncbi:MAG: GNAT family N-acetyltransferase [Bacillota bacterium]
MDITNLEDINDMKELMDLHKLCFKDSDAYISFFFGIRYQKEHSFVTKLADKIICAVHARIINLQIGDKLLQIPFLTGIATHPDHRNKGLAKALIAQAIASYKERGFPFVILHPFKVSFYENLGFAPINFYKETTAKYDGKSDVIPSSDYSTEEMLTAITAEYKKAVKNQFAYIVRDEYYFTEMMYEHFIEGGSGAVLIDNGNPNGYLLSFAENMREVVSYDKNIANRVLELDSLKIKNLTKHGEPYSMAHATDVALMLKVLPLNNITTVITFVVEGVQYTADIAHGKLINLTNTDIKTDIIMNISQFTGICLGCGYRYNDSALAPFKALFPTYNIFIYEQY